MKMGNRFDTAIEARFKGHDVFRVIHDSTEASPDQLKIAAIFVSDTIDLAQMAAEAIFDSKAKPEHAFEIYDRYMQVLDKMVIREGPPMADLLDKADTD